MALAQATLPVGIVVRKSPGVTRWAAWSWRVVAVVPGAGPARWKVLRREGKTVEYHAATLPVMLWSSDTEGYLVALSSRIPSVIVVMRESTDPENACPWVPALVTASAYEGQDYLDSGEGLVDAVPMPQGLIAWVQGFCDIHHVEEPFIKRRRDTVRVDLAEDGKGDPRIHQASDVFRAPRPRPEAT